MIKLELHMKKKILNNILKALIKFPRGGGGRRKN